jgi:hypothetical protein
MSSILEGKIDLFIVAKNFFKGCRTFKELEQQIHQLMISYFAYFILKFEFVITSILIN